RWRRRRAGGCPRIGGVPALEVKDVTVWFARQERPAVEDVSFSLDEGRIAILIGPNGSGKSTLLKAILGLVPFTGEVRVFGRPAMEMRRQIGYVPQRLAFDLTLPLTVREAVRMPLLGARGPDAEAAFRHFVDALGIADLADRLLGTLSGGQLKRALIARAMVTTPRLLLLDEPEAGIDVGGEQTLYELLDRLVSHHRLAALICSHELDLVFRYADQVLCLNRRLQCTGPPAEVLTADALARLYGPATALYRHRPGREA
ncbi:MAG TPA: metal ABC transporter ATP-binding protein, partial [Methylomirabilota bacterium]|nr:metal ABC transporter ATP-binding protein [Methylomirabilota bacterium]